MAQQRENPAGVAAISEFKAHLDAAKPGWRSDGSCVSGAQLQNFREGWAVAPRASVAHWFKRDGFEVALSACRVEAPVRLLFGKGNYPGCARCLLIRNKKKR